jgi:hypothetical protein
MLLKCDQYAERVARARISRTDAALAHARAARTMYAHNAGASPVEEYANTCQSSVRYCVAWPHITSSSNADVPCNRGALNWQSEVQHQQILYAESHAPASPLGHEASTERVHRTPPLSGGQLSWIE